MQSKLLKVFLTSALLFCWINPAIGQDTEVRINYNAPPETAQFSFLIGKWDARYSTRQADGGLYELKAIWEIGLILDGSALQDKWEIFDKKNRSLGHGTMFRTYNAETSQWEIVEITSWKPVYHHMTAKKDGDLMIMYEEHERDGKVVKGRRVFSDIKRESFRWDYQELNPESSQWQNVSNMIVKRIK